MKKTARFLIRVVPVILLGLFMLSASAENTVRVSTVDEFLAAIAPDTVIRLAPGTYDLTQASDYGRPVGGKYYTWDALYTGSQRQLLIQGANGLQIIGEEGSEIVTRPREANVLAFYGCNDLTLEHLVLGHTEAADACQGGVIYLEECSGAAVRSSSLYGCGTVGITASSVTGLEVSGCDIHHCSSAGVEFLFGSGLLVADCVIRDIGSDEPYMDGFCAVNLMSAEDIRVENTVVSNSWLSYLYNASGCGRVEMDGLTVSGCHLTALVSGTGMTGLRNLVLENNVIDDWFPRDDWSSPVLTLDGIRAGDNELNMLYGGQLASSGMGTVDAAPVIVDRSGSRVVHVSDADGFLAAVASDTTICIDVPELNLREASGYPIQAEEPDWEELSPDSFSAGNTLWYQVYDGAELCIGNVENLHIVGMEGGTCILTEPRYAYVMNLYFCSNVSFENITMGHTREQGFCRGGVLNFRDTRGVILDNCDLFGCGTFGIEAADCSDIHVQNTVIHDCTYGAAQFWNTDGVTFLGCTVHSCPPSHFTLQNCSGFSWNGTLMAPSCSFNVT